MRSRRSLGLLAALVLATLTLAACGDDDSGSPSDSGGSAYSPSSSDKTTGGSGGGAEKLVLDAVEKSGGQYGFSPKALAAKSGNVTVTLTNPQGNQAPHAIEVEGNGVEEVGETVQAGGTSTVTADLKPGRYTFYCPVGNHRAEGMQGTLTVK